jgi:cell division initiation protein
LKITPLEIKKQSFSHKFRGYDPDEVNSFLEILSDETLELQNQNEELKIKVAQLETQLADFKDLEDKWKTTMINAQESAQKALQSSQREAEIILKEAEIKAQEILRETRQSLDKLKDELELLRSEKSSIIKRLKYLMHSQEELLEIMEKDDNIKEPGSSPTS